MTTRNSAVVLALTLIVPYLVAQTILESQVAVSQAAGATNAEQTAHLLGLDSKLQRLAKAESQRSADAPVSLEELTLRQEIFESIQASYLDVDSVIAELSNEQSELGSIRTGLQARRDKTVNKLTTAALLTGSALGAAVSATQFTTLSSRTQNIGDAVGIGSGVASTILSVLAARAQKGPSGTVEETPNMLAPLLGGIPTENSYYPPEVLQYLKSVPAGEDPSRGTRLQQLMTQWDKVGRLSTTDSAPRRQKVATLTSTDNENVKVTIDDLTDRIAMLGDVRSRVSLMKRDLAALMRSYSATRQGR